MTEQEKRQHRCCFAGHRPEAIPLSETAARDWLREQINDTFGHAEEMQLWSRLPMP